MFDKLKETVKVFVKKNWPYIVGGVIILALLLYFGDTAAIDANLND